MMSVRKEDLHKLIDLLDDKHNQPAYDLLHKLIKGDISIIDGMVFENDDSPMTDDENNRADKAMSEYENDQCVDWEEIKDEL
jgi:hypothetical protein